MIAIARSHLLPVILMVVATGLKIAASQTPPTDRAETGAEWLTRCGAPLKNGDPKGLEQLMAGVSCISWINGFIDLNTTYREMKDNPQNTFCLDPTARVTARDVARTIIAYVERRNDAGTQPIRVLAHAALVEAFPCPRPSVK